MSSSTLLPFHRRASLVLMFLGSLSSAPFALGQAVATPSNPKPQPSTPAADDVVNLSPFEVSEDSDHSYGALNSNGITRFNTPLNELPVSADIFTQTFMDDVDATSVEEVVMKYAAGGGFTTSDPSTDAGTVQEGDRQATSSVTVRGLMSPTLRRDGFIQLGSLTNPGSTGSAYSTNFDIERVEVIDGPQSLLYGSGGAGGVVNTVSKQARFKRKPFGSYRFKVSQYGYKSNQLDFGVGNDRFALRVALLDTEVGGRRVNIGGSLNGYYAQLAAKFGKTTVRLTGGQTNFDRFLNAGLTFTALSTANDARNGQQLKYLIASNQLQASATGASGAGNLLAGGLNWDNADSFSGRTERSKNEYLLATAETRWSSWLTTEASIGYNNFEDRLNSAGGAFAAPNVTANTTGTWASNLSSVTFWKPTRTTAMRFAAVASHSLFGGQSKTMLGWDYDRSKQTSVQYDFYKADANWNIIGAGTSRQALPVQYYPIINGPVESPLFDLYSERLVVGGVNYVRASRNVADPTRVTADNPLGVEVGAATVYQFTELHQKGVYLVNQTSWMHNRLTTLVGARYDDNELLRQSPNPTLVASSKKLDFNLGANFAVRDWLRPYFGLSSSFNPPLEQGIGPDGVQVRPAHAKGAEIGVKIQDRDARLSGSIAFFYLDSKDENQRIPSAYINEINPDGINGQDGLAATWANVDRKSQGVQASFTYAPTRNWRMRLATAFTDGTIGTTKKYGQYYNDEFYANAAGQVTYRDGALVYVPPVASATTPVVTASSPGAMPLTIAMMNTTTSVYYANPVAISAAINANSALARVLNIADPVHGPIATGRTGLPISAMQITPLVRPPGTITTALAGESTTGYSQYSLNFTNMYTFTDSWLKGFRVGGTASLGWRNRGFYYYPTGVASNDRQLFYRPDIRRFDAIAAYQHRFRRVTWNAQVNVSNVFNHYNVLILPNPITGYTGVKSATFDTEPRTYVVSTGFSF